MGEIERDHAVCRFLYREARLLDERRFADWLDLWSDDAVYEVPTTWVSGTGSLSEAGGVQLHHLRSSKSMLGLRVHKLESGCAWGEVPPSRTVRTISNIEVRDMDRGLEVRSNVVIHRVRHTDDLEIHAGLRSDELAPNGETWRIARRRVLLAHGVLHAANLELFL